MNINTIKRQVCRLVKVQGKTLRLNGYISLSALASKIKNQPINII